MQFRIRGIGRGKLRYPAGISIDHEDVLYVTEAIDNRISLFKCNGQFLESCGSSGSALGQFHSPCGVALDKDEYIYVADTLNNRVQKLF